MFSGWRRTAAVTLVAILSAGAPAGCATAVPSTPGPSTPGPSTPVPSTPVGSPAPGSALRDPCDAEVGEETGPPDRIAIDHDDYQAEYVGRTADGRQFFLTRPFEPHPLEEDAREFVALYLFRADGTFAEARIDAFGRGEGAAADRVHRNRVRELGDVTYGRITVAPFRVERFGTTFGLVSKEPEATGDFWWVTAEPGDYMAFAAPWDCGLYDT